MTSVRNILFGSAILIFSAFQAIGQTCYDVIDDCGSGNIRVRAELLPYENGGRNIGSSTMKWGHLWINGKANIGSNIEISGRDLQLGTYPDDLSRPVGDLKMQRALVHYHNDQLVVNFNGDFEGGVRIAGNYLNYVSGSLSIGATDVPSEFRLGVAGGIITEKLKVNLVSQWFDHVFEPGYDLAPLSQVESFVKENKHLPDLPSEKEVKENGIDVVEMNGLLLKKIEELTLYAIEQEKEIEVLKQELETLTAEQTTETEERKNLSGNALESQEKEIEILKQELEVLKAETRKEIKANSEEESAEVAELKAELSAQKKLLEEVLKKISVEASQSNKIVKTEER